MQITINGHRQEIRAGTLKQLIQARQLNTQALVVEHNQRIVRQEQWAEVELQEDDTLELLSFVGGG